MPGYLNSYQLAVGAGQARGALRILEDLRRNGLLATDSDFQEAVLLMKERIADKITFVPSVNPDRITSDDINSNFEAVYMNLFGLYTQLDLMDKTLRSQHQRSLTIRQNIKKAIHRITQDTLQFLYLRDNPEYTEAKFVDFSDVRNFSSERVKAVVDHQSRTLRLPSVRRDRHTDTRGLDATRLEVEVLSPGTVNASSHSFFPDNALDQDQTSFWAESLLTDEPVHTTFENDSGSSVTVPGIVVKASVKFDRPQFVNSVQVLPFSPYPLDIIDIRFDGKSWSGFISQPPTFDWLDYIGPRKTAETVDIYFHQKNFTIVDLLIPSFVLGGSKIWDLLVNRDLAAADESGLDIRDSLSNPGTALLSEIRRKISSDLSERGFSENDQAARVRRIVEVVMDVMESDLVLTTVESASTSESVVRSKFVEVNKLQYVVGAFSIVVSDVEYAPSADYESPPFAIRSNILSIDFAVDESHSYDESGFKLTSTEYDIAFGSERSFPILPTGTSFVDQEWLLVDPASSTGLLRFSPSGSIDLYVDLNYQSSVTPSGRFVPVQDWQPDRLYTVSYVPATGQDTLDVESLFTSTSHIEYFTGTDDHGMIQLRFYPHISYEIVNDDSRWRRLDSDRGVWIIDPSGSAVTIDGRSYGFASSTLAVPAIFDDRSLLLDSANLFPSNGGLVRVDDEIVRYGAVSGNNLLDCLRGYLDSTPSNHALGSVVTLQVDDVYEPIRVFVNGQQARNLTDYRTRENPAFTNAVNQEADWQFVQIGRSVFLNKPLSQATIEVQYRYKIEYVSLRAKLRSHQLGVISRTPEIDRYSLRIKSEIR